MNTPLAILSLVPSDMYDAASELVVLPGQYLKASCRSCAVFFGMMNGSAIRCSMVSNSFSTQSYENSGQISVERGLIVTAPTINSSGRIVTGNSLKIFSTTFARRIMAGSCSVSLYASVASTSRSDSTYGFAVRIIFFSLTTRSVGLEKPFSNIQNSRIYFVNLAAMPGY